MLNRLFIIIGVLAILVIGAAFVVPSLVPWDQYRDRLAAIAGEVVGAPVRIEGDVSFSLLPQPKLRFAGVTAGPEDAPTLTVQGVEAEFSLIDFLRDRYTVTRLVLEQPAVQVEVGPDGSLLTGFAVAQASSSSVSVANATVVGGTATLTDRRTGQSHVAEAVDGELRIEALRGPFSFQGTGTYQGQPYAVRVTTGQLAEDGGGTLALSLRPTDDHFTLMAEGLIEPGLRPGFTGTMTWRQPPPRGSGEATGDAGQGALVMTSKVSATTSRVLLTEYVVVPDENRPATRLQGAAEIALGADVSFNAVISGGVIALPPRDATAEQAVEPWELVRLLAELPLPTVPGIPGTVGVDVAEISLRAFALRNVRLDARAHDGGWTVQRLTGTLPGDTSVTLSGELDTSTGRPEFSGDFALRAQRLDGLATLWRKPAEGNPLFGMPGGIEARLTLVGETLSVSNARLDLDGEILPFSAQAGLGSNRDLRVTAHLGELDAPRSEALMALLPDLATDAAFPVTFPRGAFDLSVESATIAGLGARGVKARGSWDGGVLVIDDVSGEDLGGAQFKAALTAFGTMLKPELSGTAELTVADASAPAVARLYEALGTPDAVAGLLAGAFPAQLTLTLDAPSGDGAQTIELSGEAAGTSVSANARLAAGFLRALSGPIQLQLDARAESASELARQLGLAGVPLFADGVPGHLVAKIDGTVANSIETTMLVEAGEDSLGFSGNVVVTDPAAYSGRGTIKAELADPTALAELAGVTGIWLPSVSGSASMVFEGADDVRLTGIEGTSGGQAFTGQLSLATRGESRSVTGALELARLGIADLVEAMAGPAALLEGTGLWPDGPLDAGLSERPTTGRVRISVPELAAGDQVVATDLGLDLDWDKTSLRLRNGKASIGDGTASFDLAICCAGPLPAKQVTGRYNLTGVALSALVPLAVQDAVSGRLDSSGRLDGTGESIADLMAAMTGEGTFRLTPFEIARFDATAPAAVIGLESILEMQPEEVVGLIEERLDDAPFVSPEVSGTFTIAGGVLRSPNLAIDGEGGRLFGSGSIRLADLGISGSYALTPTTVAQAATATDPASGQIVARLGGTLLAPEREFDVSALVDSVMVKAFEAEVARLEKLRAEDEARRAAEAAEQERLAAEEEARRAAEEQAAREAAEQEAARLAAEEAARQAAEEEAAQRAAEEALKDRPLDIGFGN